MAPTSSSPFDTPLQNTPLRPPFHNAFETQPAPLVYQEAIIRYGDVRHSFLWPTSHISLRQNGSVQRLLAAATVIGLFEQWECALEQIRLAPGDLLINFSDGVAEAAQRGRIRRGSPDSRIAPVPPPSGE